MDQRRTYQVRDTNGTLHELIGDPESLTLEQAVSETGKQGGQKWDANAVRFRVGSREYSERDLKRSFSDLGIKPSDVIEIVGPTPA